MINKILKTLSKNLGFKLLAVAFAFTLWVTVYNLDDPTKTKALTVNATVTNREVLEEMGKYFEIAEGTNKITFSVTAPRSILDKLDESDFVAEADLKKLVIDEDGASGTVPIDIFCTANVSGNSIKLSSSNKNLKLTLEDLMSKQFVVQANSIGEVAEGYALGKVEVTAPNVLKVSGPKSIVSQIQSVVATVDVSGMFDSETSYRVSPILLDANGGEVDTTRLTLSDTTVNVEAEILNVKEVPISVTPSGQVAEGFAITAIHSNPTTVYLKGNKTLLNNISAIQIPSEVISVAGADKDVTLNVDVTEYIPAGVELAMTEQASVEITVSVGKVKTKTYSINTADIIVTGLSNHATLEYDLSSVAVDITGLEADINVLTNEMLVASIDVTDLKEGTRQVELRLDLDDTKYTYEPVRVKVLIEKEAIDVSGDANQGDGNTSQENNSQGGNASSNNNNSQENTNSQENSTSQGNNSQGDNSSQGNNNSQNNDTSQGNDTNR